MKIGIFGGSFDPVHIEHIRLAERAIDELNLDRLLIMPAFAPPHKPYKVLAPDADRLQMCRLAFAAIPKTEICDFELQQGGTSFTYLTCRHFKEKYPSAQLFWLVGTDMLRDFPTWKYPERILSDVTLAVCARNENAGWLEKERAAFYERFGKEFAVISYNGADVSSTQIRVLAAAGEEIAHLVGADVADFIRRRGLYKVENADLALAGENSKRKAHSLRVALVAAKRCASLPILEKNAIAAALFHDCAKNILPTDERLRGLVLPSEWGQVPESVWHQFAGAYLAERAFGVQDKDILNAVRYHTSGRENMSVLEKLIFLSDMVEEERSYDVVDKIRAVFWQKGEENLDNCLRLALCETVAFLKGKNAYVYPLTELACAYYNQHQGEENGNVKQ